MIRSVPLAAIGALAAALLAATAAEATLIMETNRAVTLGATGSLNPDGVSPALTTPATGTTGNSIIFQLNSSGTNQIIFEADPIETLVVSGGGQAGVAPVDGSTPSFLFTLSEGVRRLEMNPDVDVNGSYEIIIDTLGGASFTWNVNFRGSGENRFLIFGDPLDSEIIIGGSIASLGASTIVDLIQPRFGGVCDSADPGAECYAGSPSPPVSEPPTLALFGLGIALLGLVRRKRPA